MEGDHRKDLPSCTHHGPENCDPYCASCYRLLRAAYDAANLQVRETQEKYEAATTFLEQEQNQNDKLELQNRILETHLQDLMSVVDVDHHLVRDGSRLNGHLGCEVCAILERGKPRKLKSDVPEVMMTYEELQEKRASEKQNVPICAGCRGAFPGHQPGCPFGGPYDLPE